MYSPRRSGTLEVAPSGLFGTVLRGPVSPVCNPFVPCELPVQYATLVFRGADDIATTQTDAGGTYMILLPPGVYSVTTEPLFYRGLWPQLVRIRPGHVDGLDFHIDTGIQ
jgi:hypothetical protein